VDVEAEGGTSDDDTWKESTFQSWKNYNCIEKIVINYMILL